MTVGDSWSRQQGSPAALPLGNLDQGVLPGGGGNAPGPDIAGAQAPRGGGTPAAPAGPPATPPVSPKLLVFTLDGKAGLPAAQQ